MCVSFYSSCSQLSLHSTLFLSFPPFLLSFFFPSSFSAPFPSFPPVRHDPLPWHCLSFHHPFSAILAYSPFRQGTLLTHSLTRPTLTLTLTKQNRLTTTSEAAIRNAISLLLCLSQIPNAQTRSYHCHFRHQIFMSIICLNVSLLSQASAGNENILHSGSRSVPFVFVCRLSAMGDKWSMATLHFNRGRCYRTP